MSRKNVFITLGVVLVIAAVVGANFYFKRDSGLPVTVEAVKTRDLEQIVSASGKIQAERTVNISSDTVGRVVNLAVNEGDRVHKGQFLLQIDPKPLISRVDNGTASVKAAEVTLDQMQQAVITGRMQLELAQQNLKRQEDLWRQELTTKETYDKAMNDLKVAQSTLAEREKTAAAQSSRIAQEKANLDSARYDLSRVRIEAPIDGLVTARNIQEGEMVMIGTMNNAGTVLLTLADMSSIQAEIEVDETNVPHVQIGQQAKVSIDAVPDRSFRGHVTEIGNSPIQTSTAGQAVAAGTQATNFKVKVMIDEPVPNVRPGFTCTADITTATRKDVVSAPIPAVAVREVIYDANGQIVRQPKVDKRRRPAVEPVASAEELKPGQMRKEAEGVFVLRNNRAEFVPIKLGVAGERYFEVLSGLQAGDQVITGPYNSVRGMADGDAVKIDTKKQ